MHRVITTIWLWLLIFTWVEAQENNSFNRINTETYRFYMEQKWDSLIDAGKEALKAEVDYYYLRIRLGIAYYSKHNYRTAARHFSAALELNSGDPVSLEYLYFCRLYAGQTEQAQQVRKQFKGDMALKLPPPTGRFFEKTGAEYLYLSGVKDDLFEDPAVIYPLDIAGIQSTTKHYSNATISLVNSLAPGITLSHTYTFLSKTNHYYSNDGERAVYLPDQQVVQNQYYFSPGFTTPSGYTFTPMIHILGIRFQDVFDTGQGFQGGASTLALGTLKETDFVTGLGFKKNAGAVDLHLGGWYGTLNGADQIQGRVGLTWFPLGNLNLYAGGYLNSQYESYTNGEGVIRVIPEMLFGFGMAGKIWVDVHAAMGEMTNYLENNGMFVYNSISEVIHKKVRLSLSFPVNDRGSLLYLGGIWNDVSSEFIPDVDSGSNPMNTPITYNAISIYGGISWKF